MKKIIGIVVLLFSLKAAHAQTSDTTRVVEASCGQCKFGLKDKKGCDLAVRIEGVPYFVTGTSIDKHGDAHAADGFCNAIRKAKVSGKIDGRNFVATSFVLLPEGKSKQ
ncbi:MAG: hypothetical protein EOO06_02685 [Chitinophagaceae bacterium]|nr:MAG: hypothetical protein EOO06_02685 [Chitinophagaceae bacterium]